MRLLFLTTVLPHNRKTGGEVASQAVIDGLRTLGAAVDVVGYLRSGDALAGAVAVRAVQGRRIETRRAGLLPGYWLLQSLLRCMPYSGAKYRSARYIRTVQDVCRESRYDAAVIDHSQMAWIADQLPWQLKRVFLTHNIEHQMYAQMAAGAGSRLARGLYRREARLMRGVEGRLAASVAEIWTLTASDGDSFRAAPAAAPVRTLTLPSSAAALPGPRPLAGCDIGLIGSWSWHANAEGLRWFLAQVLPRLPSGTRLQVAGSGIGWLQGRYPNVTCMGFVPDALAFLQQARVVAIPTLSGGGIQVKTLDAIASGTPVVATPLALRGIRDLPAGVRVAGDAAAFAEALLEVLRHPAGPAASTAASLAWSLARRTAFRAELAVALQALA